MHSYDQLACIEILCESIAYNQPSLCFSPYTRLLLTQGTRWHLYVPFLQKTSYSIIRITYRYFFILSGFGWPLPIYSNFYSGEPLCPSDELETIPSLHPT